MRDISLSYRSRGRVPRIQIKRKVAMVVRRAAGKSRPLTFINRIVKSNLMNRIILYSAKKNRTNPPALYSVLNPETSSDSPSAKSKGVRLVSARADVNHKITKGGLIRSKGQLMALMNEDNL